MNISRRFYNVPLSAWVVWLLTVAFFFYDYLIRVFPSVMIDSLMLSFNIDTATLGEIIGSYFYVYSVMQFPVGLLMDRFGARRLLSVATLLCGLSVIAFGLAPDIYVVMLSRLFVALGSAFAFVGMLYITSHLFPKKKHSLLIGIGNSIGILGGVFGEGPINLIENFFGWRLAVIILGFLGLILCLLIYLIVHRAPPSKKALKHRSASFSEAIKELLSVLKNFQAWINALIAFFLYATTTGFAALWGVDFLEHNHQLDRDVASFANSMIFVGWVIGGPFLGQLSSTIGRKRPILQIGSLLGALLMLTILLTIHLPLTLLFLILIFVGICSSCQILNFSHAIELFSEKATGSVSAFTNFIVTIGGALFQPLVGFLLVVFWSGKMQNKIKIYSTSDFTLSMLCFPLSFFLAFGLTFLMKEIKKPRRPKTLSRH